jgi:hypothetical protein
VFQVSGGSTGYGYVFGIPGNGGNGGNGTNNANGGTGGKGGDAFIVDAGATLINASYVSGGDAGQGGVAGVGGAGGAGGAPGGNANPAPNSGGSPGASGTSGAPGLNGGAGNAGAGVLLAGTGASLTNQGTGAAIGGTGGVAAPGVDFNAENSNGTYGIGRDGAVGGNGATMSSGTVLTNNGWLIGGIGGTGGAGGHNSFTCTGPLVCSVTSQNGGAGGGGGAGGVGLSASGSVTATTTSLLGGGTGGVAGTPGLPAYCSNAGAGGAGAQLTNGAALTLQNSSSNLIGSTIGGGAGGDGPANLAPGCGGGAGGTGAVLSGSSILTTVATAVHSVALTGGQGGIGGDGSGLHVQFPSSAGSGGKGGTALSLDHSTFADTGYSTVKGGAGRNGGDGTQGSGTYVSGGNGGDGGTAVILGAGSSLTVAATSSYAGGNGGNGGSGDYSAGCLAGRSVSLGYTQAGSGGSGGAGVVVTSATLTNQTTIAGGNGGTGGTSTTQGCFVNPPPNPNGGGGSAIVENGGAYVVQAGTVIGGFLGGSTSATDRAPAIALHNGGNTLELRAGFVMQGRAVSDGGDTLAFGGTAASGFDLGTIYSGGSFDGFAALQKVGTGTWLFWGNGPGITAPTTVQQGTLQVDGVLTGSAVTVNGGMLAGVGSVGALTNHSNVTPGDSGSAGTLNAASYTGNGTLTINANATSASRLSVAGTATLAGTLNVTFSAVPSGQAFTILQANSVSGTFATVNIFGVGSTPYMVAYTAASVIVQPVPATYSIGGSISGATAAVGLTLTATNPNNAQMLTAGNGSFTFATKLQSASNWSVTVNAPPAGQVCGVTNGSGTNLSGNVGNIAVSCVASYTVTAAATGTHGTITPASQSIGSGSSASFVVTPKVGFEVLGVTGDTCTLAQHGTTTTWTTNAITQDCAVTATFAEFPTQCTGTNNFNVAFFDAFSSAALDPARWTSYAHGGVIDVANNSVTLIPGSSGFPYVAGVGNPIPAGNFSVRWIAAFGPQNSYGDGSLAVTAALPADLAGSWSDVADAWQDGGGYRVQVRAADNATVTTAYSQNPAQQTVHDVEYCWLGGSTEVYVDGVQVLSAPRNANIPRPHALWFGNPSATSGTTWNPFTLYYVEVRALNDEIFKDGFETP